MCNRFSFFISIFIVLTQVTGCTRPQSDTSIVLPTRTPMHPTETPISTPTLTNIPTLIETPDPLEIPLSLISKDRIFSTLEDLTSIQPYSGWRNSANTGEAEALDYMANALDDLTYLQNLGLELERQSFHVFLATEIRETRLYVTIRGNETEVPANAPRGHRNDISQALRFDSDGRLNDTEPNPVVAEGKVVLIRSARELDAMQGNEMKGKIVFLDYALIDPTITAEGTRIVTGLFENEIAGLALVTQFSSVPEKSHGNYLGDGLVLEKVTTTLSPPTLYVRLEDLAPAGISNWDDLSQIEAARIKWDSDVFSPGTSGNLVVRIPGADSSQAIILGAHIDSANSPGAIDNGINSVVLLEVARILNEAQIQPAVDLYLVWFGSEELWLYGSQYFVNTHQELLDRTIAAFLMDSITESVPSPILTLDGWSYSRFGNGQLAFPRYLAEKAALRGININEVDDFQGITSDNGVFNGFVPQAGFSFGSQQGGYAHSPYDAMEIVQGLGDLIEQVTAVALSAALETGVDLPALRIPPESGQRALIVGSHTEVPQMTATTLIDLDRALAWEGFDVDVIPYGQAVNADDLEGTDIVIVLPVIDYPVPGFNETLYDEAWSDEEIKALVAYVEQGGLLVLTNSANRIQLFGLVFDANEDRGDVNALSENFGVLFEDGTLPASNARPVGNHPLMKNQSSLILIGNNGVPFTMQNGEILAETNGKPVVGLIDYGKAGGQVLVLADEGILGFASLEPPERDNFEFLRNLARYARNR
jgi:hypothetical protein